MYFKNEFNPTTIYELETALPKGQGQENVPGKIRKLRKRVIIRLKDIYMSFLEHLNEEFDDDLLLDCINILQSE